MPSSNPVWPSPYQIYYTSSTGTNIDMNEASDREPVDGDTLYIAPQIHSMGPGADRNRVVHVLGNIRKNINGERVLFIEEIF